MANTAKLTLHLRLEAGTNTHHIVEALFKAFARALRAAVGPRPAASGVPSTKGVLVIAILDYGMGNLRSVEKALEHVGAEPLLTRDHDPCARADGVVLPGVGAFPRAMERRAAAGLDRAAARARRGGRAR